ncbi:protein of unknown function (plasmid) [Cupriavidus taiwanensis]|uniref:Uncharacterized protein n=1 Tax=Cupriavidus taiwanensis TaxID=164546 RepID=A0A375HEH7_9BURK|nr:protein of unknown function [Cupriavidus taiwanensis]SOZ72204.1 protein of unknown function [Cupriavidus taiwanensis]SOZ74506.1 protein of unknown function [Cupriavidus taiwanensis]SPA03432.1 protein of unknown function [Cupriavidus taiwanensis]SPA11337.1 protein of unknown function [Cupriavidus taiwanensis]
MVIVKKAKSVPSRMERLDRYEGGQHSLAFYKNRQQRVRLAGGSKPAPSSLRKERAKLAYYGFPLLGTGQYRLS